MTSDFTALRDEFPILQQTMHGKRLVYLDNGATTQKPIEVIEAVSNHYKTSNSNVGRSVHGLSAAANNHYEGARLAVQIFLGAKKPSEIIFTKSTTEAINQVAQMVGPRHVGPGDEVIVSELEHHANLLPWIALCRQQGATLRIVPVNSRGELDLGAFEEMLGDRTKIVAIAHVSNVLGSVQPIKTIVQACKARGILTLVDGAQAVAHEPIDVTDIGCDFYCFSAHKMYGPTGVGVLYGREERLQDMEPLLAGGGGIMAVSFDGIVKSKPLPFRLEPGTPNIEGVVGLGAAVRFLTRLGKDRIAAYERELVAYATKQLRAIDGVEIVGDAEHKSSIVSFHRHGFHAYDIGARADQCGVALSTGAHCAMPLLDKLKLVATVRVAFGVYNSFEDIDTLCEAVKSTEKGSWTLERPNARF